jgi:hypothetical protein
MGFMAGFGEGFSNSFNKTQDRKAAQEQDAFQLAYTQYQKNNAQYESDKKADQKAISDAKTIVASLPGVNPGAWTFAAKLLRSGYTASQVEERLTTTKFSDIPTPDGNAQVGTDLEGVRAGGSTDTLNSRTPDNTIDQQTADSGLAPKTEMDMSGGALTPPKTTDTSSPAPMQAGGEQQPDTTMLPNVQKENDPTVAAPAPQQGNGLLGGIGNKLAEIGNPALRQQHMIEGANDKIKGTVGEDAFNNANKGYSPEQLPDTVKPVGIIPKPGATSNSPLAEFGLEKGLTPNDVARADADAKIWARSGSPEDKARAARYLAIRPDIQAAMDANNQQTGNPAVLDMLKPTLNDRMALADKKASVLTSAQTAKELGDMIQANGSLLTWGAKGITGVNTAKNNAVSILDIANNILQQNDPSAVSNEQSFMAAVDDTLNKNLPGWEQTSEDERMFDAKIARFVYAYGKSIGISGQNMSNKDAERLHDAILNSNNPGEFINNLKAMVNESVRGVNNVAGQMSKMPDLIPALNDPQVGPALKATLAPIDLGGLQGWADSPTEDISANPLQPAQGLPKTDTTAPASTQPTGPTDEDISKAPIKQQGVIDTPVMAKTISDQLAKEGRGREIKPGMRYIIHDMGNGDYRIEIR